MTIHKAKGLEFPITILADAGRERRQRGDTAYLLPETGLAFRLDSSDSTPLLYKLARTENANQEDAEEKRLLYVAMTRAQEKLIISGHCKPLKSGVWKTSGWLEDLVLAGQVDLKAAFDSEMVHEAATIHGHPLRILAQSEPVEMGKAEITPEESWPESQAAPLYHPLPTLTTESQDLAPEEAFRSWRATGERQRPPAEALGQIVHTAIQAWCFPDSPALPRLLETAAFEAGLADSAQRIVALRLAEELLGRLQRSPLWQEIDQASERYHEVPFTYYAAPDRLVTGYIDLLYRSPEGWQIVDFKTDGLNSPSERYRAVEDYRLQMRRYAGAALALLLEPARVRLCFLDDGGMVGLEEVK
jgi:ATP-dependent exoDNAse (exonuclease V) beta subunit